MSRRRVFVTVAALTALAVALPAVTSARASAAGNLARARADASRLLGLLHVPPGAVELAAQPKLGGRGVLGSPGYDEATPNLVDAHHWWRVRGSAADVLAYVSAHLPRGAKQFASGSSGPRPVYHMKAFSLPPVPGVLSQRVMAASVVALSSTTTVVRTDGEAVWITPRPATEVVPTGIHEIDIRTTAFMTGSPILALSVTHRQQVKRIVTWINAMGVAQPGAIACPDLAGPTVSFVFRAAGGERVARASGMDFDGSSGACNPLDLRIHGHSQPPLIGNLFRRVERLLGVRFEGGL